MIRLFADLLTPIYSDKIQANAEEELPERLIGAVRVSHIELSSAVVPVLPDSPAE